MKKILIIFLLVVLTACSSEEKSVDVNKINEINYENVTNLPFEVHSKEYMVFSLSDLEVLYGKDLDKQIYPASLTKVVTMAAILNNFTDLGDCSSYSFEQQEYLISQDASLAWLSTDTDYTLEELLYALILPSGADAAKALENYCSNKGLSLVDMMNELASELGCNNSHFVNTTGLHDENHYTSINDLLKIMMYVLQFKEAREVLETYKYELNGNNLNSTLSYFIEYNVSVLGGKTGFTLESGQSIITLLKNKNRSYLLLLANAMGDPYNEEYYHFEDIITIVNNLLNKSE